MGKTVAKKVLAAAFAVGVTAVAATALARPPAGGGCGRGIVCLDVWAPVLCPNGQIYSNSCYAYKACQTNCVPYGGPTE